MKTLGKDEGFTSAPIACTEAPSDHENTILTDQAYFYLQIVCGGCLLTLLSLAGVVTNCFNMIVYWRLGTREAINISFFALSLYDHIGSFLSLLTVICDSIEVYSPLPTVNISSVQYVYIGYTRAFMYVTSTLVTVYLSVERCVCIMRPFSAKCIFTADRVVIVNLTIVMFGLASFSPAWATQGLRLVFDPSYNTSRLSLWLSFNRRHIDIFVDTFNGSILPIMSQVIITISSGFMIYGIKQSAKFRKQSMNKERPSNVYFSVKELISTSKPKPNPLKGNIVRVNRDIKVTTVIALLAMLFFVCNLPVFIVALIRPFYPEIDYEKHEHNLYMIIYTMIFSSGVVNATLNTCIYYNFCTKYRLVFVTLGCCRN